MDFTTDRIIVTASEESNSSRDGSVTSVTESDRSSDLGCGSHGGGSDAELTDAPNDDDGDVQTRREIRKMRRVMANRRSARESRERRKRLLNDLQDSVDKLSAENSTLAKNNLLMRQELLSLLRECGVATSALPI